MKDEDKKRKAWLEKAMDVMAGGLFGEAYKAKKKRKEQLEKAHGYSKK